jgi:hypothetical protein
VRRSGGRWYIGLVSRHGTLLACLTLAMLTFGVYSAVATHPFVNYDDPDYVTENPHVTAGLTWKTVKWALTSTEQFNWHPLTWISHALDCQLFGLSAGGHHITSLILHIVNVVLLFLLLSRATGSKGRSFVVAALFAIHPLNVESVAWVAERKSVLCTLFSLLTVGAYGWYARKPEVSRYFGVVASFVLALASKPMAISLPFVLLLLDFWPLWRVRDWSLPSAAFPVPQIPFSRAVLEKLPLIVLSGGSAVITFVAQRSGGAVQTLTKFPFASRVANAIYSYAMYCWKSFWPSRLAVYYPHPLNTLGIWRLGLAILFLAGASTMVWRKRQLGYPVTGWLLYLGTLIPVIGIVQVGLQSRADRYAYIPLIGIFVITVWATADWAQHRSVNLSTAVATVIIVCGALSFITWRQLGFWSSSYDLWSHAAEVTQDNFIAEKSVGDVLVDLGRADEALPHYQNAARIHPLDAANYVNVGGSLQKQGRLQEAMSEYETAIRMASASKVRTRDDSQVLASAFANLASIYGQLGDDSQALQSYREAEDIDARIMTPFIPAVSRLVAAHPTAEGYLQLGQLFLQARSMSDAEAAYEQALQLDPTSTKARKALESIRAE